MTSRVLRVFDPDSADEETRRLSRLAQSCWSPLTIVYDPLKAGSIDSTDTVPHDKAIVRALNADFAPNKRIKGTPECTVFIANLNPTTTNRSLGDEFSRYGRVVKATVVEDIITGRSRGYGFVEFSLEGEAAKAYEHAHRSWLDGNRITVDMECGRLLPGWVPRRLGGGFNGRKESGQLRFGCRERPFRKPIKLLTEKEIKTVFEKTMGRKLTDRLQESEEPEAVGSKLANTVSGDQTETTSGRSGKSDEGSGKYDRGNSKHDGNYRRDVESRKHDRVSRSPRGDERRKRTREDDELDTRSDVNDRDRRNKKHKKERQSSKHKKKKKHRSRSSSTPDLP